MKPRSTISTLVSLSSALDVNFSFFDALDEAEAADKRGDVRKTSQYPHPRRSPQHGSQAHEQVR